MNPTHPSAASILDELRDLPLCDEMESCSPGGLQALAPLGRIDKHATDEVLFHSGERNDGLRFVIHGRVALYLSDPSGDDHTVGTASKGDLLGWSALRGPEATWTVSARATRGTRCLVFPGQAVRALCDQDRAFGYCLMRYAFECVAGRLKDARLQLLDVYGERR